MLTIKIIGGDTALIIAARSGFAQGMTKLLSWVTTNVNLTNNDNETAAMIGGELYKQCREKAQAIHAPLLFTIARLNKEKHKNAIVNTCKVPLELNRRLKAMLI